VRRWVLILLLAAALGAVGLDAWARGGRSSGARHHHHSHNVRTVTSFGFFYGFASPYYAWPGWSWYYWPIYGVPPPWMVPPAYAPGAAEIKYFCPDSRGYYPDVSECPSEWLTVVPRVASPPASPD